MKILGNWIRPNKRGIVISFWIGNRNFGDIMGLTIGYFSMHLFHLKWYSAIFLLCIYCAIMMLIIFVLL